jgi:hypothetical protein
MNTAEELKSLKRIEDLLTVLVKVSLAETLQSIRADKQQQFLYENTGRVAVKELSKRTRFSVGKISGIWQEWESKGLIIKDGKSFKKVLS